MTNLDSHFPSDLRPGQSEVPVQGATKKWSGRRTIVVCLLASGGLWTLIFFAAKALIG